jgi:hypothetical protein
MTSGYGDQCTAGRTSWSEAKDLDGAEGEDGVESTEGEGVGER